MRDELGGKIMEQFVWIRAKTYSSLIGDSNEDKKSIKHKNMCHKTTWIWRLKIFLEPNQLENEINHLEKK